MGFVGIEKRAEGFFVVQTLNPTPEMNPFDAGFDPTFEVVVAGPFLTFAQARAEIDRLLRPMRVN